MDWLSTIKAGGARPQSVIAALGPVFAAAKLVRITGFTAPGDPLLFWRQAGAVLGDPAEKGSALSTEAGWTAERAAPGHMHTASTHADLGIFYVERPAGEGGERLFVDAETIARRAAAIHPDLRARLFTTPVRFFDAEPSQPILREAGNRVKICWNGPSVLPGQGEDVVQLADDFRLFLREMVEASPGVAALRLAAGDAIIFRNDEVLHGGHGSLAGAGVLWKAYFVSPAARAAAPSQRETVAA